MLFGEPPGWQKIPPPSFCPLAIVKPCILQVKFCGPDSPTNKIPLPKSSLSIIVFSTVAESVGFSDLRVMSLSISIEPS